MRRESGEEPPVKPDRGQHRPLAHARGAVRSHPPPSLPARELEPSHLLPPDWAVMARPTITTTVRKFKAGAKTVPWRNFGRGSLIRPHAPDLLPMGWEP